MTRLLTTAEVADRLGKTPATLARWRKTGAVDLPFLRDPGGSNQCYYDEEDVQALIESRKVRTIAEERAKGTRYCGATETGGGKLANGAEDPRLECVGSDNA